MGSETSNLNLHNGGLDMKVVWIMSALFGNLKSEVYSLKWVKVVIWRCSKWCGLIGEVLQSGYYLLLVIWANVFKCQFGGGGGRGLMI